MREGEKSKKLLKFEIADGAENRTIVSGIAQYYQPEDLVGKQVCFVANLAPRTINGIESQGMICRPSTLTTRSRW